MSETAASGVPTPDPTNNDPRERMALVAFVLVAVIATVSWLVLLAWLVVVGLRAVGVG